MDLLLWVIMGSAATIASAGVWIGTIIHNINQDIVLKTVKDAAQDEQIKVLLTNRDKDRELLQEIYRKLVVLESRYK